MEKSASMESAGSSGSLNSEKRARVFAALSDPTRVRLAGLLACHDELSGTELAELLNISLALFCHHTSKMTEAGLLTRRKEGQTTYYSLNREALAQSVDPLLCDLSRRAKGSNAKRSKVDGKRRLDFTR